MGKYNFDINTDRKGSGSTKWDDTPAGVVPMWCADMDFDVAPPIVEAIQKRAAHPCYGYSTDVCKNLNNLLVDHYKRKFNAELKPEWIVWIPCVMGGCETVLEMLDSPYMYNVPIYSHTRTLYEECGLPAIEVPMKIVNNRYTMDEEAMEAAVTPETKCFIICNPHNPVGLMYEKEELELIEKFCTKHNLIVVSDEIHCEFELDKTHIPYFSINENAAAHSVTISSAGKSCNIPGLPWSFVIIPNEDLRKRFMKKQQGRQQPTNVLTAAAYEKAFDGSCDEWKAELLDYLRANRDYLEERVANIEGISMMHVEGTYLGWIDCTSLQVENTEKFFMDAAKVQLIAGNAYEKPANHVRINFGCPRAQLKEALDRMEAAVKKRLAELAE